MSVYLLATLDTKGAEAGFLAQELRRHGLEVTVVDTGSGSPPTIEPQIARELVFGAAGTTLAEVAARGDRGWAVTQAAAGAARLVGEAYAARELDGVIALGGSAGTTIGTAAMRALGLGVAKVMVSTLASGQVRHFVGDKDIFMLGSIVDISGLNRISRTVLGEAARAMAGLIRFPPPETAGADRPLVAATMFGVTTPCVERARQRLGEAGYEVLVFHATGTGGQAMESLIADGQIAGVLDITTTELADELVGGVLSAGPDRLTAAARAGVPQVVSVGALDMVNFHAPATIPAAFQGRKFYHHNAAVTLMRTTPAENAQLGQELCRKLALARGPVSILLPRRGVSAIDQPGQPFDDPEARQALFQAVRDHHGDIELVELDRHLNDVEFADAAAEKLIALMQHQAPTHRVGGKTAS